MQSNSEMCSDASMDDRCLGNLCSCGEGICYQAQRIQEKNGGLVMEGNILTATEAAAFLRISKNSLYAYAKSKDEALRIPGVKIGKKWRFHKQALEQWVIKGTKI